MAKGNLFLGMARKKIGDVVFYRANGEQISRARNRSPRNPRSAKQSIQRMVLATASKMAAAWRPIVDHSFEGYNVGEGSVRHFQQLAMARLRGQAAYIINGDTDAPVADFAIKGAPTIGKSYGLRISSGSLTMKPLIADGDYVFHLSGTGSINTTTITTQAEYESVLALLGLEPGDQLTWVSLLEDQEVPVASFGAETNYSQLVRYARVVFVPTLPENFSGTLIDTTTNSFNSALIERTEGKFPTATIGVNGLEFAGSTPTAFAIMAGVIRSKIDVNGKWRYSTCDLVSSRDDFDYNNAAGVYPSYMDNAEGIDLGDNLYLRNAVASPLGN